MTDAEKDLLANIERLETLQRRQGRLEQLQAELKRIGEEIARLTADDCDPPPDKSELH